MAKSKCIWGDEAEVIDQVPKMIFNWPHPWRIKDKPNLSNIHPKDELLKKICHQCDLELDDCLCDRCEDCGELLDDCCCSSDEEDEDEDGF